tara:strand:- start:15241 stop:15654 length:414 start_codon:yes stop_codon:yes gene_type:complete
MSVSHNTQDDNPLNSRSGAAKAIELAGRVLSSWGATYDQAATILRVSRSVYAKALNGQQHELKADRDQLKRAAMVVDMHAAIRIVFSNPENVKGFMGMPNNNPFFDGHSPLEIIGSGDFVALYETHKRVNALRGGGW